ncbi:MAG: MotA/TolQ/ExbB proton channel family protein [Myxococcota bacterium]
MSTVFALVAALFSAPALAQDEPAPKAANADLAAPDTSLQEAYQREFAFLAGLKKQLEQRLGRVQRTNSSEQANLSAEIDAFETTLLNREDRVESLREQLTLAREQSPADDRELVEATLAQATATLTDYGVELPELKETDDRGEAVKKMVDESLAVLGKLSSIYETDGSFFSKEGTKADGKIVYVGRVGAYGVSADGSVAGALAPAGGGKLKVWKDADGETARALGGGQRPTQLSLFVIENMNTQVDDGEGQTIFEHIDSGGAIAWIIMALGAVGLVLSGIRAFMLFRSSGNTDKLETEVGDLMRKGQYAQAATRAADDNSSAGRVLGAVIPSLDQGVDDVEDLVSENLLSENRRIETFAAAILVIAAVAPLLGLLGTVTGMISTFDVITKYGTGDPKMLSGGISTALVTTELGLVVAIPTLLIGNMLKGWGDGIEAAIEHAVLRVINIHKDSARAK